MQYTYNFDSVKSRFNEAKQKPAWAKGIPWYKYHKIVFPVKLDDESRWFLAVIDLQERVLTYFEPGAVTLTALLQYG